MTATQIKIAKSRLAALRKLVLTSGSHEDFEKGVCAMEAVAWLAKEEHSDAPACACPAISAFMRAWNDAIPSDARRTELLTPLLPLLVGTRTTNDKVLVRRAYMAIDWRIRVATPAWLRLAGLTEHADALSKLPEITTQQALAEAAKPSLAARSAASLAAYSAADSALHAVLCFFEAYSAAYSAARSAARSAADSAAYSAADSVAYSAARSAARSAASLAAYSAADSAAYSAARSAAYSAADSAAYSALAPTVAELQVSAADLVRRMCSVTPKSVAKWSWDAVAS